MAVDSLAAALTAGDRAALARAITLIESTREDHKAQAQRLLDAVMQHTGRAHRIGITGVPGVGKSTMIERFGLMLCAQGLNVAVLAVDPSSARSGGSILGDKTRMSELAAHPNAFIRPSPAGATLGGVARRTREAILLCEAAGFNVVIVETVGVGQSETVVADMVDIFLALMLPNAGDELQGIKKGLIELADMLVVNKADLDMKAAERAKRTYADAMHILTPVSASWTPPVLTISGLTGEGLDAVWAGVTRHAEMLSATGERAQRRADQQVRWMRSLITEKLLERFESDPVVRAALAQMQADVAAGAMAASLAADRLIDLWAQCEP